MQTRKERERSSWLVDGAQARSDSEISDSEINDSEISDSEMETWTW
jgi:hypothetical protein